LPESYIFYLSENKEINMALPNKNKARAAFGAALVATSALLSAGAIMSASPASAGVNLYDGASNKGRWAAEQNWNRGVCIDHPETGQRECAAANYPGAVPGNWRDFGPTYNPQTDGIDMPPQGGSHTFYPIPR
jgi:hypothetical protein